MSAETTEREDHQQTTDRSISSYQYTKTGIVGERRPSMLRSELQLLPQLGKPQRRGHILPSPDFTYGLKASRRDGGVAEALRHRSETKDLVGRDFVFIRDHLALNRAALEAGMLTARNQARFRNTHDIQKKVFLRHSPRAKTTRTFPDDTVFGLPYRASTPMAAVLQRHFGTQWLDTLQHQQTNSKKQSSDSITFECPRQTKASLLRQVKIPVPVEPCPSNAQFARIEHQVDSFRSEAARRRALLTQS